MQDSNNLVVALRERLLRVGLMLDRRRHAVFDIDKQAVGLFLRAVRQLRLDVVAPGPIGRPAAR